MRASQSGDAAAYRKLLKSINPMIEGYVRRRIFDGQAVEDLTQEILLKIHAYRHTYDSSQLFESWMFTICKNQIIDYLRARGRKKESLSAGNDESFGPSVGHDGEAQVALQNALARLSPDQREAIQLAKIEGLSLDEVAQRTNSSLSAVKVRTHRAMKIIQQMMLGQDNER
jgi:RNA polymerase sigma-70 factor (ECF subfamily)